MVELLLIPLPVFSLWVQLFVLEYGSPVTFLCQAGSKWFYGRIAFNPFACFFSLGSIVCTGEWKPGDFSLP